MSSVCFGPVNKGIERGVVFAPLRRKLASTHREKRLPTFPSPQPGCHLPNSPLLRNNLIIPAQGAVSAIPARDGNVANLFLHLVAQHHIKRNRDDFPTCSYTYAP
jgi:hypothetical protein